MKASVISPLFAVLLSGLGVDARLRTITRTVSVSPTPSPSGTRCAYPAASPAIPATSPCVSGINAFALQVDDCQNPGNGQYVKIRVASVNSTGANPPRPYNEAHLWLTEACTGGNCTGSLLTPDPTLFYLDSHKNMYIAPNSPLGANGSFALGKRMEYDSFVGDLPGAVVPLLQFAQPGGTEETHYGNFPFTCDIASNNGSVSCVAGKASQAYPWGTQPNTQDEFSDGVGTAVAIADFEVWEPNCYSHGPACAVTNVKAVPACQWS